MATTDRNYRVRFMNNNFAKLISSSIDFTSELSAFPFTNALNPFRSRVWKPSGYFEFSSALGNDKLYINDGSDKTITLSGTYATPALAAAHIQTQLNASSSNWTVAYNSATTYKFTISNTGSVTLRLATTTDACWDTIGFTTLSNITATSFTADQQRNHLVERATFDLGHNAEITFFSVIGELDELFTISESATVTLQASNLNQWDSPPLSITLDVTDKGIYQFLDNVTDTKYRFWRLSITDRLNPLGPEGLSIGVIYLGDYITLSNRNVGIGFENTDQDQSEILESESGVLHYDRKTAYGTITGAAIGLLDRTDKDNLKALFEQLGKTTPFFISLDPLLNLTSEITELTKYVVFNTEPRFTHIFGDTFSMTLNVRELV